MAQGMNTSEEFLRSLSSAAPRVDLPSGWYNASGDCVFVYSEDVTHRAERVDDRLTVYRAIDDDRIVGLKVKDIRTLPSHELMHVLVQTGPIEVVTLLFVTFSAGTKGADQGRLLIYKDATHLFRTAKVDMEDLQACGG